MQKYNHIAVLMGGPSAEREVSLHSGASVAAALRQSGYRADEVDVTGADFELPAGVEAVFVALHGEFGEDGQAQKVLHERGIPYTGTRHDALPLSFDKRLGKRLFDQHGLPTPAWELLRVGDVRTLKLPVVVKPPLQGSSIGVHRVTSEEQWLPALDDAFQYGDELLVETFIDGRELTVGLLDGEPLPLVEICAASGQYDYFAKYQTDTTVYQVPAKVPQAVADRAAGLAVRAAELMRCRHLARVDFRLDADDRLFLLEVNTIPGFTETSLLPKAAHAAGLSFEKLCNRLVEMAAL